MSEASASSIICGDDDRDSVEWVQKHMEWADVVILGKVKFAEMPDPADLQPLKLPEFSNLKEFSDYMENTDFTEQNMHFYQTTKFEVLRSWKGPWAASITTKSFVVPGSFGVPFVVGETYLVFGHKGDDGLYSASTICGSTARAKNTVEGIALLDELSAVQ